MLNTKYKNVINNIEPILIYQDGTKQACEGELFVKTDNIDFLKKIIKNSYEIETDEYTKNLFLIKINDINTFELFDIIKKINKTNQIDFVEPNFIRFIKPSTNDPYFSSQWAINNQGYLGGIIDADMDVDDAWAISTGQNIKVAVVDEGVQLDHPDLASNLLPGYDATDKNLHGGPNINNDDMHGTGCAGIISAVSNNNKGISGVAYNAKIIPIRIAYSNGEPIQSPYRTWVWKDKWVANGINWAWQHGADILSNSWGGGSSSATIALAFNNALAYGRNGKGCISFVSSGNHNTSVSFPAYLSNVFAVGATNMFDERKSPSTAYHDECWYSDCHGGSNYGDAIDIVAPGVRIYTTDLTGSSGLTNGDYVSSFNGTSSACPQAAGVAALILASNPNLTAHQVADIISQTADKIPNYLFSNNSNHPRSSWNNEVGYGRINAYKALLSISLQINGSNLSCGYTTYNLSNISPTSQVNWNISNNLQIVGTPTNTSITVTPINNNISEPGFIEVNIDGFVKRKNIWIGKSKSYVTKIGSCYEPIYKISATYPDHALGFKISHNGNIQYHNGISHYEISTDDYNLQDGQSTVIFVNIRNNCGWSQTYPITISKPTLCDCGYDNPDCGGSSGPPTILDAGISDDIFIYPNPSKDELNINIGSNKTKEIQIINSIGKIIQIIKVDKPLIKQNIDKLANGVYILKFINIDGVKLKKIIISH